MKPVDPAGDARPPIKISIKFKSTSSPSSSSSSPLQLPKKPTSLKSLASNGDTDPAELAPDWSASLPSKPSKSSSETPKIKLNLKSYAVSDASKRTPQAPVDRSRPGSRTDDRPAGAVPHHGRLEEEDQVVSDVEESGSQPISRYDSRQQYSSKGLDRGPKPSRESSLASLVETQSPAPDTPLTHSHHLSQQDMESDSELDIDEDDDDVKADLGRTIVHYSEGDLASDAGIDSQSISDLPDDLANPDSKRNRPRRVRGKFASKPKKRAAPGSTGTGGAVKPKKKGLYAALEKIAASLRSRDQYGFFLEPVDTTIVEDYLTVVDTPMDLGTMTNKVTEHVYRTIDEFQADFALVVKNAKTYNAPDTLYWKAADRLEYFGTKLIENHRPSIVDEMTREELVACGLLPSSAYSVGPDALKSLLASRTSDADLDTMMAELGSATGANESVDGQEADGKKKKPMKSTFRQTILEGMRQRLRCDGSAILPPKSAGVPPPYQKLQATTHFESFMSYEQPAHVYLHDPEQPLRHQSPWPTLSEKEAAKRSLLPSGPETQVDPFVVAVYGDQLGQAYVSSLEDFTRDLPVAGRLYARKLVNRLTKGAHDLAHHAHQLKRRRDAGSTYATGVKAGHTVHTKTDVAEAATTGPKMIPARAPSNPNSDAVMDIDQGPASTLARDAPQAGQGGSGASQADGTEGCPVVKLEPSVEIKRQDEDASDADRRPAKKPRLDQALDSAAEALVIDTEFGPIDLERALADYLVSEQRLIHQCDLEHWRREGIDVTPLIVPPSTPIKSNIMNDTNYARELTGNDLATLLLGNKKDFEVIFKAVSGRQNNSGGTGPKSAQPKLSSLAQIAPLPGSALAPVIQTEDERILQERIRHRLLLLAQKLPPSEFSNKLYGAPAIGTSMTSPTAKDPGSPVSLATGGQRTGTKSTPLSSLITKTHLPVSAPGGRAGTAAASPYGSSFQLKNLSQPTVSIPTSTSTSASTTAAASMGAGTAPTYPKAGPAIARSDGNANLVYALSAAGQTPSKPHIAQTQPSHQPQMQPQHSHPQPQQQQLKVQQQQQPQQSLTQPLLQSLQSQLQSQLSAQATPSSAQERG
ncbi:uncharacterized protein BJ171DRAFT_119421 [Polychytrium aggregatum]|uniref:uncharacterized protein n=1 Tax=Polychytrium aggregatum TaxID=110093 RepID=UPI0022FDDE07|nr:uncharacterized protein BJ171DRAFT_119421 [Polychytrium aggregatum]KAI9204153.1 hypothetical protein BJ171DRAFT_119421 [Polychytrium aggregatum]